MCVLKNPTNIDMNHEILVGEIKILTFGLWNYPGISLSVFFHPQNNPTNIATLKYAPEN